jgi:WD40 repeat protein
LQRERDAALLTRSRFLAEFARQQNEVSDFGTALAVGLEAISDSSDAIGIAVASEAVVELDQAARSLHERRVFHVNSGVWRVEFDSSDTQIKTVSEDWKERVWDAETGDQISERRLSNPQRSQRSTDIDSEFGRSGSTRLTWSTDGRHRVRITDSASTRELGKLIGHQGAVWTAIFDRSGAYVLTASADNTARLWDATSARLLKVFRGHGRGIRRTIQDDGVMRMWEVEEDIGVRDAIFDASGTRVLTASFDETARLWDIQSRHAPIVLRGHKDVLKTAVFDRAGTRLVTASRDGTARVWDATTGAEIAVLVGRERTVFDPSVITVARDGTARLTGARRAIFPTWIKSAAFSPDGSRVVTTTRDDAILWDTNSGAELAVFRNNKEVTGAVFGPSGISVLTADRDQFARIHTARIWDLTTGIERAVIDGHWGSEFSAVFDASGTRVLTASDDKNPHDVKVDTTATPQVWDAQTGAQLAALRGHTGPVVDAAFDPSGKRVITASSDGTARLWDTAMGAQLAVLRGHEAGLTSAVFDHTGSRVVTASADCTARIWRVLPTVRELVEHARAIMPRELTPEQRKQFFLD